MVQFLTSTLNWQSLIWWIIKKFTCALQNTTKNLPEFTSRNSSQSWRPQMFWQTTNKLPQRKLRSQNLLNDLDQQVMSGRKEPNPRSNLSKMKNCSRTTKTSSMWLNPTRINQHKFKSLIKRVEEQLKLCLFSRTYSVDPLAWEVWIVLSILSVSNRFSFRRIIQFQTKEKFKGTCFIWLLELWRIRLTSMELLVMLEDSTEMIALRQLSTRFLQLRAILAIAIL